MQTGRGWGRTSCLEPDENRETNHPSLMQISRAVRWRTSCRQKKPQLFCFVHQMQLWFCAWLLSWAHAEMFLWCNQYCFWRKYVNIKLFLTKEPKQKHFFSLQNCLGNFATQQFILFDFVRFSVAFKSFVKTNKQKKNNNNSKKKTPNVP